MSDNFFPSEVELAAAAVQRTIFDRVGAFLPGHLTQSDVGAVLGGVIDAVISSVNEEIER